MFADIIFVDAKPSTLLLSFVDHVILTWAWLDCRPCTQKTVQFQGFEHCSGGFRSWYEDIQASCISSQCPNRLLKFISLQLSFQHSDHYPSNCSLTFPYSPTKPIVGRCWCMPRSFPYDTSHWWDKSISIPTNCQSTRHRTEQVDVASWFGSHRKAHRTYGYKRTNFSHFRPCV